MIHALKKMCPGSYYDRASDTWRVLATRQVEFAAWQERFRDHASVVPDPANRYNQIPPLPALETSHNLLLPPFPYQENGMAYILQKKRVLVGDQPGLGKTLQAIGAITMANAFPCIIICPATLKENWRLEWLKWTGKRAMILSDRYKTSWTAFYEAKMCDVFIVNFESLEKYFVLGYDKPGCAEDRGKLKLVRFRENIHLFKSAVVDESHRCRNPDTRQSKLTAGILRGKHYRILLSGTPMVNTPMDLWSQLCLLGSHKIFGDEKQFIARYVKVGAMRKPANLDELHYYLHLNCFYRREKSEVAKDLPPKLRQVLYCELSNRKEYDKAENDFVNYLEEVKKCTPSEIATKLRGAFMVKLGILKQIAARGKLDTVSDYVDSVIGAGEKLILFCNLKEMIHAICERYPHCLTIYGEDTLPQRQVAIERFQKDSAYPLIICNFKSGGVGVTLTAASRVGFIEQPWHFADLEQCEDRAHRIGQQSKDVIENIQCTNFLGINTMDDFCYEKVMEKKSVHDAIMGTSESARMEVLNNLLNLFKKRRVKVQEGF